MDIASFREIAGILAGVLAFTACPIYVRSILRGETRPDRATWWILSLGAFILTASYWSAGARETIWIPLAYCVCYLVAAILSVFYGAGKPTLSMFDKVCLAGALASAALWWFTDNPVIALSLQMIMEMFGLIPTIEKTFRYPTSESALAWGIATVASIVNLFAIGDWTFAIAAYPLFVLLTNALMSMLTIRHAKESVIV